MLTLITLAGTAQEQQGFLVLKSSNGKWAIKDADIEKITIQSSGLQQGITEMWYLIGADIADGMWGFTVPTSRIPMYTQDDSNGLLTYTAYFKGSGFKLVGEDWNRQWGSYWGEYVMNDGGSDNISLSAGYYTVSLDTRNYRLTIQPTDITVPDYTSIQLTGTFNSWGETEMQRVPGDNSHDWYCNLTLNENSEMKFKANGSWDANWGGTKFPSGPGVYNGDNISVPAGNYIVLFNDLTGYYRFYDPENPTPTTYTPLTFPLPLTGGGQYVDLATYDSPSIQLFDAIKIPLAVDYELNEYDVDLAYENKSYNIGSTNNILAADLAYIVTQLCGRASIDRQLTVSVTCHVTVNGYPEIYTGSTTLTCKLPESDTPEFVYFIGATDGWQEAEQKLAFDPTTNTCRGFCYVADPNGWGLDFKFQKTHGNWDSEINAGMMTCIGDVTGSDNFTATAGEGVYYMEIDFQQNTLKATKVQQMSIIGSFNNWNDDVDMTWDADRYCFTATSVGATAEPYGWKLRINHDWGVNLGGDSIDNLYYDGPNLNIDANTIELFPTRRDSNYIYCTVKP